MSLARGECVGMVSADRPNGRWGYGAKSLKIMATVGNRSDQDGTTIRRLRIVSRKRRMFDLPLMAKEHRPMTAM
jgi:hypothetical protein